jgi:hypothetical protein
MISENDSNIFPENSSEDQDVNNDSEILMMYLISIGFIDFIVIMIQVMQMQ